MHRFRRMIFLLLFLSVIRSPVYATPLITDPEAIFSVPSIIDLPYLTPVTDPVFGTKVIRIANDTGQATTPVNGVWGSDARHHYSKDQPWNSDGSLLVLQNKKSGGTPKQLYLDGNTYQPKFGICSNYNLGDDRWHHSKQYPRVRINVKNSTLEWFDVVSCTQLRSWALPFAVNYFGQGEGNASLDGRYVALADDSRIFMVDMDPQAPFASYASGNRRIGPVTDLSDCGLSEGCIVTNTSVSPSGKYVIVGYKSDHLRVFDVNPQTLALTPRPMPTDSPQCSGHDPVKGFIFDLGHADMTLNPFDNNEDVIIGQRRSWCPPTVNGKTLGRVIMVRLKDNSITSLTRAGSDVASAQHISARNIDRPGWIYVTFHSYPEQNRLFNDEFVAIKLDGTNAVERLAHRQVVSFNGCYRCEAHGVPSRDGKRVLWAKTKTGSETEIKAHILDTRESTSPASPVPLYWRHETSGTYYFHLINNTGVISHGVIARIPDLDWEIAGIGDLNNDGEIDIVMRNSATGVNWLWLMQQGRIIQSDPLPVIADLNWSIAGLADLDGDQKDDIIWHHDGTGLNWWWRMNSSSIIQSTGLPSVSDTNWQIAGISDLDGDRKGDIVLRHANSGNNWLWRMNGSSILESKALPSVPDTQWQIAGVGDLDGNNKQDIIWRNQTSGVNWFWSMNGTAVQNSQPLPSLSAAWSIANIADFNRDNKDDLYLRNNQTGQNWLWVMNGSQITQSKNMGRISDINWKVTKSN